MTVLADQTVLVTGANRGMGRGYVTQLLDRGVATVYAAARNPDTIEVSDSRVVALRLDVTDAASVAGDSPKSSPVDVVRQVLDGVESGADEVLADEITRQMRAHLGRPIGQR